MIGSTLKPLAVLALLGLAACDVQETGMVAAEPAVDPGGWRLASGKMPTPAEFTALSATCQDRGGAIDSCLTNLGLKRAP
jgi:hypothetical protein